MGKSFFTTFPAISIINLKAAGTAIQMGYLIYGKNKSDFSR